MEVYYNGAAIEKAGAMATHKEAGAITTGRIIGLKAVVTMEKAKAIAKNKVKRLKAHGLDDIVIQSDSNGTFVEKTRAIAAQKEA